ncbi:MAG: hypothetical protein ACT452_18180 [Microthrixaceae bacterium]
MALLAPTRPVAHAPRGGARGGDARDGSGLAVLVWLLLVAAALWWGHASIVGRGLAVNAAPLVGRWRWEPELLLAVPATVAAVVVWLGPRVASSARWPLVPPLAGAAAALWAVSLAASDGWTRITSPLTTRHEYEPFAASIDGPGRFLRDYVAELPGRPIHVQGHPPGASLVPWALDTLRLGGAGWFAALVLAGWGLAVAAALVAARTVAGEQAARRAAPALVLLPAALWAGTSADALFAGIIVAGVALAVMHSSRAAVAGGVLLGFALLLTYGAAPVLAVPVAVHGLARRPGLAGVVLAGAIAVLGLVALTSGFWWLDGLEATRRAYADGIAGDRPDAYFALAGNPAALALAIGPAVAAGLALAARRWRSAGARLPILGLLVVFAANASLLSKGEVERIWLPFVPVLALAAPGDRRGWLVTQAALALVLQAWLQSKW